MAIFSLIDTSIIIGLFAFFILISSLAYYFNTRILNLERTVGKQNSILSEFIKDVKQNTIVSNTHKPTYEDDCDNSEDCEPEIVKEPIVNISSKINVSECDNESSCLNDSEDTSNFELHVKDTQDNLILSNIAQESNIDMSMGMGMGMGMFIVNLKENDNSLNAQTFDIDDDTEKQKVTLSEVKDLDQLEKLSSSSTTSKSNNDDSEIGTITTNGTTVDFKKMRFNQLRDVALSKGIDVKGKKKNELVEALNKQ